MSDHNKSKDLTDRKLNIKLLIILFTLSYYYAKVNMVINGIAKIWKLGNRHKM